MQKRSIVILLFLSVIVWSCGDVGPLGTKNLPKEETEFQNSLRSFLLEKQELKDYSDVVDDMVEHFNDLDEQQLLFYSHESTGTRSINGTGINYNMKVTTKGSSKVIKVSFNGNEYSTTIEVDIKKMYERMKNQIEKDLNS